MKIRTIFFTIVVIIVLTFSCFAESPTILAQPQNVYLPSNYTFPVSISFSILATGDNLSYQWQSYNLDNEVWVNFSDSIGTSPNITFNIANENYLNKQRYRCIVSSESGSIISNVVSVSVGAFVLDSLPQLLIWISDIIESIFSWVNICCLTIVSDPFLLFTFGFVAIGLCCYVLSRLIFRS